MAINEVFPNSLVKKVLFQIKYPTLFYIEDRIGDFQVRVMEHLPESTLLYRKQVLFADFLPNKDHPEFPIKQSETQGDKVWQFKNQNVVVNITSSSLDVSSDTHKTYNNPGAPLRFRDILVAVLNNFFEVVKIPIILRMGLRYVNEIKEPELTRDTYNDFINTSINTDQIQIPSVQSLDFAATLKKDKYSLNLAERIKPFNDAISCILDFDAFALNVKVEECFNTIDDLHEIISNQFESIIKEPVYTIMRKPKTDE
ncbi:MAG: TIGR04255 family protein [Bacteroidales bacterium]